MTPSPIHAFARIAAALMIAIAAGCASVEPARQAAKDSEAKAAVATATQTIADFSAGMRCMDTLLADYGTRDVSVIVEDLADPAQRANAGAKEMLVSVVSDMTQRSRAIRLVASGKDWGNTVNHMSQALKREPYAVVPQYALRGSVSRLDNASASTLGVDLTLLTTHDLSVVPGIATRNSVVLSKNGGAEMHKFGVGYNLSTNDKTQALRAVVELAAIELFGRLARVPYWTCLGTGDANQAVAAEIQDWYDGMAARPAEIIKYFQGQLRLRRVYDGPIDGTVNPQLKEAVARYREVVGLSREPKLSLDFFRAYLAADHHRLEARVAPPAPASNPVAAAPAGAAAPTVAVTPALATPAAPGKGPLALRIAAVNETHQFARGEAVQFTIRPNRDAHVYCFLQDETRKIIRFFPNRFQRDSRVQQAEGLRLPGAMRFEIIMNPRGLQETITCFATERDVLAQLPAGVNAGDFAPLPLATLEQVRSAFTKVVYGALAQDSFQLQPK